VRRPHCNGTEEKMKIRVQRTPVRLPGFRFAGVHCGLKEGGVRDIALICSDVPASAASAFTTNRVQAAPVLVGLERAHAGRLQAIVVNSGNANAYTGRQGVAAAREMCTIVARELHINERSVIPSSTGRIGVQLPRNRIKRGVRAACKALSPDGFHDALEGMMTTDAFPKFATETVALGSTKATIVGMAKGAGMIAPRMVLATRASHATMLAYILTDAAVSPAALRRTLTLALPQSFNAIVVDGDTSLKLGSYRGHAAAGTHGREGWRGGHQAHRHHRARRP
jgi:glutamate N-acetyltransferase/amino-acid N-acetyltransferase